jgi:hypothetical protein
VELKIVAKVSRFGLDDPRTLEEMESLVDSLRTVVTIQTPAAPSGTKGAGETAGVVLVMVTALQQTPYLVEALKVWLVRDRGHRVEVSWKTPDGESNLEISATSLELLERAWRQIEPRL